jgi:hypothetical protein
MHKKRSNEKVIDKKITEICNFTYFLLWSKVSCQSKAQFIVPIWGDKVEYGIGLLYRFVRLHRQAGRYDNPIP